MILPNCELCSIGLKDPRSVRCRKCLKKGVPLSLATRRKISRSVKRFFGNHHGKIGFKKGHKINVGRTYSEERNRKIRGHLSPHWRGGKTSENDRLRSSNEYKRWREAVFRRDNFTCIWCEARCKKGQTIVLNADHIKRWADYPELRFVVDNGRTLCVQCHQKTPGYKVRL